MKLKDLCEKCGKPEFQFHRKYDKKTSTSKIVKTQYEMPKLSPHGKSKAIFENTGFICSSCIQSMIGASK